MTLFREGDIFLNLDQAVAASALILAHLGDTRAAESRIREVEQLAEDGRRTMPWRARYLGRAHLLLGRAEEARRLGDQAVAFFSHSGHHGFLAHALHLLAEVATHPDQFDGERCETHYHQTLALAEPRGMRPLIAHCHLGLGKLYRRTDRRPEAHDHLATASTMYRDMDMRFWLEQAEEELRV